MKRALAGSLNTEDLYRIFFDLSGDGLYVLDRDTNHYLIVNPAWCALMGYPASDFLNGTLKPTDLVHKDDWHILEKMDDEETPIDFDRLEIKILTKAGKTLDVEISIHNVDLGGRRMRLGSVRNVSERKRLRDQLNDKLRQERNSAMETAKANIRIGQLYDKIASVPVLASALLDARDEQTLLKRTATHLRDPQGMNYRNVSVYLAEDGKYELAFSTDKTAKKTLSMKSRSRVARIIKEAKPVLDEKRYEEIVPMKARSKVVGAIIAHSFPGERILFDGASSVRRGQHNVLVTLGNILGLAIQNIRLFQQIEQQSILDQLTNVYNRRFFDRKVTDEFQRAARYKRNMSLIVIDLDRFKGINDTHGHQQGDIILKEVADLLKDNSREVDTICRYGGDEFVILLPETEIKEAESKAKNLRKIAEKKSFTNLHSKKKPFKITLSMGISQIKTAKDEKELFKKADEALYESKKKGRNRVTASKK